MIYSYCVINEATTTSNSATDESIAASVDLSTPLYILRPGKGEKFTRERRRKQKLTENRVNPR